MVCLLLMVGCSSPELEMTDGAKVPLDHYQGKWLLVNYWAVWCKPCIEEIPELNAVNSLPEIQVLGYNFDRESGARLAEQSRQLDIQFPLLSTNPAALYEQAQPAALPATLVISPEGQFHSWLMGPQTKAGIVARLQAGR